MAGWCQLELAIVDIEGSYPNRTIFVHQLLAKSGRYLSRTTRLGSPMTFRVFRTMYVIGKGMKEYFASLIISPQYHNTYLYFSRHWYPRSLHLKQCRIVMIVVYLPNIYPSRWSSNIRFKCLHVKCHYMCRTWLNYWWPQYLMTRIWLLNPSKFYPARYVPMPHPLSLVHRDLLHKYIRDNEKLNIPGIRDGSIGSG